MMTVSLGASTVDPASQDYADLQARGVSYATAMHIMPDVDLHDVYAAWLAIAGFISNQVPEGSEGEGPGMAKVREIAALGAASVRAQFRVPSDAQGN